MGHFFVAEWVSFLAPRTASAPSVGQARARRDGDADAPDRGRRSRGEEQSCGDGVDAAFGGVNAARGVNAAVGVGVDAYVGRVDGALGGRLRRRREASKPRMIGDNCSCRSRCLSRGCYQGIHREGALGWWGRRPPGLRPCGASIPGRAASARPRPGRVAEARKRVRRRTCPLRARMPGPWRASRPGSARGVPRRRSSPSAPRARGRSAPGGRGGARRGARRGRRGRRSR